MPANAFALVAGGAASVVTGDWVPLAAAAVGSLTYSVFLSLVPSFRRAVRANLEAQVHSDIASPEETQALLAELAPSQRQHYEVLRELKDRILASYERMPGGRVLADWPGLGAGKLFENRDLQPTLELHALAKGLLAGHLGLDAAALATVFPESGRVAARDGLLRA